MEEEKKEEKLDRLQFLMNQRKKKSLPNISFHTGGGAVGVPVTTSALSEGALGKDLLRRKKSNVKDVREMFSKFAKSRLHEKEDTSTIIIPPNKPPVHFYSDTLYLPDETRPSIISSSINSELRSNFGELVLYNDEGKPYIDVNRLVYNPRPRAQKEIKERLSWYVPDHVFIMCNFISLICSGYLLAASISATTWDLSIESVSSNNVNPSKRNTVGTILKVVLGNTPSSIITPSAIGVVLLLCALLNGLNVLLGIFACIYGYKILLIQHTIMDFGIVLFQLIPAILVMIVGECDEYDLAGFQEGMEILITSYAGGGTTPEMLDDRHYATTQLNDIQISMQCCGAANWTDYLNARILGFEEKEMVQRDHGYDGVIRIFPYSCCRVWWVRNIYCADGVHTWARPGASKFEMKKFRERINPVGCMSIVWLACERLYFTLGSGLLLNAIVHLILVTLECITAVLQIRSLDTIVREMKAIEEPSVGSRIQKEEEDEEEEDGSETDGESSISKRSSGLKPIADLKSQLAMPSEDEIQFIKSRTAFAQFESRVKRTELGKIMRNARKSIYAGGIDEPAQTYLSHLGITIPHSQSHHSSDASKKSLATHPLHPAHHAHHHHKHNEAYDKISELIKQEEAKLKEAESKKAAIALKRPPKRETIPKHDTTTIPKRETKHAKRDTVPHRDDDIPKRDSIPKEETTIPKRKVILKKKKPPPKKISESTSYEPPRNVIITVPSHKLRKVKTVKKLSKSDNPEDPISQPRPHKHHHYHIEEATDTELDQQDNDHTTQQVVTEITTTVETITIKKHKKAPTETQEDEGAVGGEDTEPAEEPKKTKKKRKKKKKVKPEPPPSAHTWRSYW